MTIAIPQDKLATLTGMYLYMVRPAAMLTLKQVESMVGFWEFCLECLPPSVRAFTYNAHRWLRKLKRVGGKTRARYVPRALKADASVMLQVLPVCNGVQPLRPLELPLS